MTRQFNIAIAGATGLVGQELISILAERKFPINKLKLLASAKSAGEKQSFKDQEILIEELDENSFENTNIVFLALDNNLAKQAYAWANKAGAICIDKSSAFREDPKIPLVVPEVNPQEIKNYKNKNLISSPNCTTAPLVQILEPLNKKFKLTSATICTYQAVSGAGKAGIQELDKQTRDLFNLRESENLFFPNRIAFNLLAHIPGEEEKLVFETQKILDLKNLKISATCVRVPVFNSHSAAVHMSFDKNIDLKKATEILSKSKGLQVADDLSQNLYPMPTDASGGDMTLVGRIRLDNARQNGLACYYSSDNLRTGAALNSVKIAEILCQEYLK